MKTSWVAVLCATALGTSASGQLLRGIGVLPGDTTSLVNGLSADGTVAVGNSLNHAVWWTPQAGLRPLAPLPGGSVSNRANAASRDGSLIVGSSGGDSSPRPVGWLAGGNPFDLGTLPGGTEGRALGVSPDGRIVVGQSSVGGPSGHRAVRWVDGAVPENLGALPGGAESAALGSSEDGSVIAGASRNASNQYRATRWTRTTTTEILDLGVLSGGNSSQATAINLDGSVIVGFSNTSFAPSRAFRWTEAGGMRNLGSLPGGDNSIAYAVRGDGRVVVGKSVANDLDRAFIWTPSLDMLDLNSYLPSLGADLTGWTLTQCNAISADGSTIAGIGVHRLPGGGVRFEGWVATIPVPSSWGVVILAALPCSIRRRAGGAGHPLRMGAARPAPVGR